MTKNERIPHERLSRWVEGASRCVASIRCDSSYPAEPAWDCLWEIFLDLEGDSILTAEKMEREACAKLCDEAARRATAEQDKSEQARDWQSYEYEESEKLAYESAAEMIRARGQR